MSKKRDRHVVAVLSDVNIEKELRKGNLIIEPFNEKQLNISSYDITLGSQFMRRNTSPSTDVIDLKTVDSHLWKPYVSVGKSDDIDNIILYANETILVHSIEFIGGTSFITTQLTSIPSLSCITIKGYYCNVGDVNRLIFTITNETAFNISFKIGDPIARVVFLYSDYPGQHIPHININKVISTWTFPVFDPIKAPATTAVTTSKQGQETLLQKVNSACNKIPSK